MNEDHTTVVIEAQPSTGGILAVMGLVLLCLAGMVATVAWLVFLPVVGLLYLMGALH